MADMTITLADLKAVLDVLDDVIEHADSLDVEQALEYRAMCQQVAERAKTAAGLLQTTVMTELEGQPRQIGNKILAVKSTGKWRPNHDKIRSKIVSRAIVDDNGEATDAEQAADTAVRLTYELFVAPSAAPKQTGLKRLRLSNSDVCDWETTGKELIEVAVNEGGDER